MYQWPLTAIATAKVHNVVAHPHTAPRSGDSVVETSVEEFMVEVHTGRTICHPTVQKVHKITDSTRGNRRGRLKKRLEANVATYKASILQADEPPAGSHNDVGYEHPNTAAGGVAAQRPPTSA